VHRGREEGDFPVRETKLLDELERKKAIYENIILFTFCLESGLGLSLRGR